MLAMTWYWIVAFSQLTWHWIRKGECYLWMTGSDPDTGSWGGEFPYPNPWRAVKAMHFHQTDPSCSPGDAEVSDGKVSETLGSSPCYYVQAPDGWDALAADREYEEDEWPERYLRGL